MPETPPLIAAAFDDRYLIERELGSGGMAIVYLARDRKLDREVALKVLRPELGAVLGSERFLAEIKISARLDHPHILTLIDSGNADGFLYYVLPYVRGESLRAKLDREHQLSIEEALAITRQVATALDYAHRQGLVHRDIKPENILIQEGEAMLTDFGIALAVKEAGGNRLTQTGLSLGTPQYMSPEQATGDRGVDARSDVYSLAAVFYEMIAGEPPVTGANAQSMIAKLMTEKPTHLRILRDSIPVSIDTAVARALSKTPADRYTSAGDFSRALENFSPTEPTWKSKPGARRRTLLVVGIVTLAAITAIGSVLASGKFRQHGRGAVLGERTQLTVSGAVLIPAISPDGKQLAYAVKHCTGASCVFSIVVQDVGGSTSRTILEAATAAYGLEWSPDRRNIAFWGTLGTRSGTYLLSALGGSPRFLVNGPATFYAGGDSLLLGPTVRPDSVFWIHVTTLDGVVRDSIRVSGPGQGLTSISVVPGTNWIVTLVLQLPHGLWQVMDRSGKVADHVVNACTCGGKATSDAVWLARAGEGPGESIVRIALDPKNGHLAARQDTMVTGLFTAFSLTADGGGMLMDQGTYDRSIWALDMPDLLNGHFPDGRRIAHGSNAMYASISPDGARLLMWRSIPTGPGRVESRYSVMPFPGGQETPLGAAGTLVTAFWTDSVTVALSNGQRLSQLDVRTGVQRNSLDLPDSVINSFDALPEGWIWVPATSDKFVISTHGQRREIRSPGWYSFVWMVAADQARKRVFYGGLNRATGDSIGVGVLTLEDGSTVQWESRFGDWRSLTLLTDGSALVQMAENQESLSFHKLLGPGRVQALGTPPRPLAGVTVSRDLKRATAIESDYRADAWLSKVIRQ